MKDLKAWLENERQKISDNLKAKAYVIDSNLYHVGQIQLIDTILDLFEEELK